MLDLMRKNAGTWIVKFMLGAIIIVFSFWGVGSYRAQKGNRVATVNGKAITMEEYRSAYDRLLDQIRQRFGDSFNSDLAKALQLEKQALNQIIEQRLLMEEAQRLDLRVTDDELTRAIREMPFFQTAGSFDRQRYQRILAANHMSPEEFEQSQRADMLKDKLRAFVTSGVKVSDFEAREWYNWSQTSVRLDYVLVAPSSIDGEIVPEEGELKGYFDKHRTDYEIPPMVRASFMRFAPDDYKGQVKVSEDEIGEYYDAHRDDFKTEETVEARHILFRLDADAPQADVDKAKEKADQVTAKAKAGEDFATLAKTYSEGPTRDSGGLLGAFSRGRMVKPFEEKAFSMEAGEISEPVRTQFGWHIIKVEKKSPASVQSLEQATGKIRETLVVERAKTMAYDAADSFYGATFEGDNLDDLAGERGLAVGKTAFFSKEEGPAQVADAKRFADIAFSMPVKEISDVQEFSDGFYLIQVSEKQSAKIPDFETVADRVKKDWTDYRKDELAKAKADGILSELAKDGKNLETVAGKADLTPASTDFFRRNAVIPGVGYESQINAEAFRLTSERPVAEKVLKGASGYYVIVLKERKLPADEGFEKQREQIERQLLGQKQNKVYADLVSQLRESNEIEVTPGFLGE